MAKKRFSIAFVVTAELEVDESVLAEAQTEDWRKSFYNFSSDKEVADHIAYNLLQERSFTSLDGFAHRKTEEAVLHDVDWEAD